MKKQVSVLVGAGSIGQAIIRRVSAGKHVVLADYSVENAERAAKTLENAGFECSTIKCDLGSKEDILKLVEFATSKGEVTNVVNAAGDNVSVTLSVYDPSGISQVKANENKLREYTLSGTLAHAGQKGIFIKNGKKQIIY